jgi:hypothetical protein
MHFEVLIEDRSGGIVVEALLSRMLPPTGHSVSIRPHRGKGEFPRDPAARPDRMSSGLLDLLPAKLRAYSIVLDPASNAIVVLMDSDKEDPEPLRERISGMCSRFAPTIPLVVALSVEEMEAWILGDSTAIFEAFPDADRPMLDAYRQDSICGTWEWLARVLLKERALALIREGYPMVGIRKHEWADAISPFLEPSRNLSPSFRRFSEDITKVVEGSR